MMLTDKKIAKELATLHAENKRLKDLMDAHPVFYQTDQGNTR